MTAITIAILGAPDIARELGKKGTQSDVTLFNSRSERHAVTLVEPTQFPEKFTPLITALRLSDRCILVVTEISRALAETIATVDLFDQATVIAVGPSVGDAELAKLLKGTRLQTAPRLPLDLPQLRQMAEGWTIPPVDGPVRVPIDHCFPVKGVGAVALGIVRAGTLRAHEKLRLYPSEKVVEIRSIQVHDVDVAQAGSGDRVGVALKGVEADEVSRGQVLGPEGTFYVGAEIAGDHLHRCPYYRGDWGDGSQLNLSVGLQIVPASVTSVEHESVHLLADRPIAYRAGEPGLMLDLSATNGPRIAARVMLNKPKAEGSQPPG